MLLFTVGGGTGWSSLSEYFSMTELYLEWNPTSFLSVENQRLPPMLNCRSLFRTILKWCTRLSRSRKESTRAPRSFRLSLIRYAPGMLVDSSRWQAMTRLRRPWYHLTHEKGREESRIRGIHGQCLQARASTVEPLVKWPSEKRTTSQQRKLFWTPFL